MCLVQNSIAISFEYYYVHTLFLQLNQKYILLTKIGML